MHLNIYQREIVLNFVSLREGETKIGQTISTINHVDELINDNAKFVILGIPEDIGPRANLGNGGAVNAWQAFLKKFLNMQSNQFLNGKDIILLGEIDVADLQNDSTNLSVEELRSRTAQIDQRVYEIITHICKAGKTPIVIGGGHNNCYPILKGVSESIGSSINCINIDPHADLRQLEGRHSGNGFTAAMEESYLSNYYIIGLHQQYNSQFIWDKINASNQIKYSTYEDYLDGNKVIPEDLFEFSGSQFGLDLDLDSIANMPTSAKTPSGFSLEYIRKMLRIIARQNPLYFHLPEGAPTTPEEELTVGKALAYLVGDFVKCAC